MSRILSCKCGFYVSFGNSIKGNYFFLGEEPSPFYTYNPKCPECKEYMRDYGKEIEFNEFFDIMKGDASIIVMRSGKK